MNQWQIIPDAPLSGPVQFGVEALSGAIRSFATYWPKVGAEDPAFNGIRVALAGPEDGVPAHGYRVSVEEPREGRQLVRVIGADEAALMHGCMDFAGRWLGQARLSRRTARPYYINPLFAEAPLPAADYTSAPAIARRGLWTWGLAIYDWRGYLENMARLRLNEVIIWNDFAPVNGRDIVARAHELGIRVIWGYAWGWDTTMRLDVSEEAVNRIVEKYEREYAPLGGDGIYFQSFTETSRETLDGRLIAEAVVEFVNRTAGRLLDRHPGLRLQFGLHADSVKNRLAHIAQVDPRIEIIWENCGDFPYHSLPDRTGAPEETRAFTEKLLALRPNAAEGAVFKSMVQLDWGRFEHQAGPAVLGRAAEETIRARLPLARQVWRYVTGEWLDHGEKCPEIARLFAGKAGSAVYNLVEDGLFEREIPLPVALFAEALWDPFRPWHDILRETAQRPDISMT